MKVTLDLVDVLRKDDPRGEFCPSENVVDNVTGPVIGVHTVYDGGLESYRVVRNTKEGVSFSYVHQ